MGATLKDWAVHSMDYVPIAITGRDQDSAYSFDRLSVGSLTPYWDWMKRHVKSADRVAFIRNNLKVHRHRLSKEISSSTYSSSSGSGFGAPLLLQEHQEVSRALRKVVLRRTEAKNESEKHLRDCRDLNTDLRHLESKAEQLEKQVAFLDALGTFSESRVALLKSSATAVAAAAAESKGPNCNGTGDTGGHQKRLEELVKSCKVQILKHTASWDPRRPRNEFKNVDSRLDSLAASFVRGCQGDAKSCLAALVAEYRRLIAAVGHELGNGSQGREAEEDEYGECREVLAKWQSYVAKLKGQSDRLAKAAEDLERRQQSLQAEEIPRVLQSYDLDLRELILNLVSTRKDKARVQASLQELAAIVKTKDDLPGVSDMEDFEALRNQAESLKSQVAAKQGQVGALVLKTADLKGKLDYLGGKVSGLYEAQLSLNRVLKKLLDHSLKISNNRVSKRMNAFALCPGRLGLLLNLNLNSGALGSSNRRAPRGINQMTLRSNAVLILCDLIGQKHRNQVLTRLLGTASSSASAGLEPPLLLSLKSLYEDLAKYRDYDDTIDRLGRVVEQVAKLGHELLRKQGVC